MRVCRTCRLLGGLVFRLQNSTQAYKDAIVALSCFSTITKRFGSSTSHVVFDVRVTADWATLMDHVESTIHVGAVQLLHEVFVL